jgi:hypothetical protein
MFMSDPGRGIIGGVLIAEAGYCRSAAGMLLGYVSSVPSKPTAHSLASTYAWGSRSRLWSNSLPLIAVLMVTLSIGSKGGYLLHS